MQLQSHVEIVMLYVDIIMLHTYVDKNNFHVIIIIFNVDIIYPAWRGKKCTRILLSIGIGVTGKLIINKADDLRKPLQNVR